MEIKNASQIKKMAKAGKILAFMLHDLKKNTHAGMSAYDLELQAIKILSKHNVTSPFLHFSGYPYNICVSVNEEIVHGFPSKGKIFKDGDVVSIDAGVKYQGYCTDAAITFILGKGTPEAKRLLDVTEKSLVNGIKAIKPGVRLGYVQSVIGETIVNARLGLITDLTGHGIGKNLQEDPQIPNYGNPNKGLILAPGMTFCLEPMVNCGNGKIALLDDEWTIVSKDNTLAAHFEHTIVVTKNGAKVLTNF